MHLTLRLLALSALGASLAACTQSKTSPSPDPATSQQAPVTADAKDAQDTGKPHGRRHDGKGHDGKGPDGDAHGDGDGHGHGRGGRRGFGRPWDTERFMARADKDKNGKVELTELPEAARARFAEFDANKDGALSKDELDAFGKKLAEKRFAAMDKNKDGSLTADELPERAWGRIKVADADGNNAVSLAEMTEAQKTGKLRPMGGRRGPGPGGPGGDGKTGEPENDKEPELDDLVKDAISDD